MKRLIPIILCLLFLSCREETIPIVSVEILPEELVGLSADTTFDTIPYQLVEIMRDTFYVDSLLPDTLVVDSIRIDTLQIDTFSVDTFYIDTIRLVGSVSYAGDYMYGPAIRECGFFCLNDSTTYITLLATEQKTSRSDYGTFSYILPVRNTDLLYVYAYVVNPMGEIWSQLRAINIAKYDSR